VAHLAAELDISSEQVTVLSFEPVEWSDASLGCPRPGIQQGEWVPRDITKAAVVGISTWAWRSGEWTLEMTV
jgi:hypothetical protein